jgi:hypothetical protein
MVRQYINLALTQMACEIGGAVVLLAHPSRSGLQGGDYSGGSTGWNNGVRPITPSTTLADLLIDVVFRIPESAFE